MVMTGMNGSIGTRYRLEGLLDFSARGWVLRMDDGGIWVLDTDSNVERHIGGRVTIEGVRSGFDRVDVDWIGEAAGE
jgi:hypothetical protein